MKNIILASQSPRRRELLTQIGLEFEVHPAGGEEIITSTDPVEVVKSLSTQKAAAVKEELEGQLWCMTEKSLGNQKMRRMRFVCLRCYRDRRTVYIRV